MKNYFSTKELVPRQLYALIGEQSRKLIDNRIVGTMNVLREWSGHPITINSEAAGRNESGFRTSDCKHYSPTSMHSVGKAIDSVSRHNTPKQFHLEILNNPRKYPHVSFIELDVSWLHIDCRDRTTDEHVRLWSPTRGFVSVPDYLKELEKEGV